MAKRSQRSGYLREPKTKKASVSFRGLLLAVDAAHQKIKKLKSRYDLPPGSGLYFSHDGQIAHIGTPLEDLISIEIPTICLKTKEKWAFHELMQQWSKSVEQRQTKKAKALERQLDESKKHLLFHPEAKIVFIVMIPPWVEIRLLIGTISSLTKHSDKTTSIKRRGRRVGERLNERKTK